MIFVTGGTGRIGNILVKELVSKGYEVTVLVRESSDRSSLEGVDCSYVVGSLNFPETYSNQIEAADAVFHFASYINITAKDKELTNTINIDGARLVTDLCHATRTPLIYASSIHAFEAPEDGSMITENTPLSTDPSSARGLYDYSKGMATQYIKEKIQEGLKAVIIHPTGVTGPNDYRPSFFGGGMVQLIKSELKTTFAGLYDYVDARDVVSATIKAFEQEKYGESYILSGEVLDMKDYISYLKEFTGIKADTQFIGYYVALVIAYLSVWLSKKPQTTPYGVRTMHSNSNISHEKASQDLGYSPRSVKESLNDQYDWFIEFGYLD